MMALNHGKHVLCEKPLAMNYAEAKDMIDFAREKKLFLMEVCNKKQQRNWLERTGTMQLINSLLTLSKLIKECSHITKIKPSPKFRPKYFVLQNRILVQMGPSPIQFNKWTEINNLIK